MSIDRLMEVLEALDPEHYADDFETPGTDVTIRLYRQRDGMFQSVHWEALVVVAGLGARKGGASTAAGAVGILLRDAESELAEKTAARQGLANRGREVLANA